MPIEETIVLFDIEELPEDVQEKAIQSLIERDFFGVRSEYLEERFKEELVEYGLPTDGIEFSLGWCQGDGVAFYGDIDVVKLLHNIGEVDEYAALVEQYGLCANINRNSFGHHYSHWNTMDVHMEREREYNCHEDRLLGKKLWELIKLRVVSVSRELEKMGYEMIEANQAKEYIIEQAQEWEMLFRADGRLWS